MPAVVKHEISGKKLEEIQIDESFLTTELNRQLVKDYIVAIRANARQWSANTKGRSEVNHTGKKPHPQKGTGGARQGCLAAPQYKGGGRVFAPKPKFDQHVKVNRKEKRAANCFLLSEKIAAGRLCVLKDPSQQGPKTSVWSDFFDATDLAGKRVLILGNFEPASENQFVYSRSVRNLQKVALQPLMNINAYDIAVSHQLVVLESAFEQLLSYLKGE